jgi:hypothetical protein
VQSLDRVEGVFVSAAGFLTAQYGGAQVCTKEYIATLQAAGLSLHFVSYNLDNRLSSRVFRKIWPSSYIRHNEPGLAHRIREVVKAINARFVFLNQVQLAPVAEELCKCLHPGCKIVALSHGLESTDLLHTLRFKRHFPDGFPRHVLGKQLLADSLLRECAYRSSLDAIFCLSPFDVELEHWLGARQVAWIPRTVNSDPVEWKPRGKRLGFVGTLDHAPNIEGLLLFLRSLSRVGGPGVRIRIVGGPGRIGRLLMKLFSTVDYLGMLPDDELRQEASTWNGFINPIFCYPRGCSTKLATAISWQIPIVTTTPGRRGYTWKHGRLLIADSPDSFSSLSLSLMDLEVARKAREQVSEVAKSSPSVEIVGRLMSRLLAMISYEPRGADEPICAAEAGSRLVLPGGGQLCP